MLLQFSPKINIFSIFCKPPSDGQWLQCDQIAGILVKYLAICKNNNSSNSINICPNLWKNCLERNETSENNQKNYRSHQSGKISPNQVTLAVCNERFVEDWASILRRSNIEVKLIRNWFSFYRNCCLVVEATLWYFQ